MTNLNRRTGRLALVRELFAFLWAGKRWWLVPIVVVLLLLAGIIVFVESSALAPLLYPLF